MEQLNIQQIRDMFDVSRTTLHRWEKTGKIVANLVQGKKYYDKSQIEHIIALETAKANIINPLFRDVNFINITNKAKNKAFVSVRISHMENVIYVKKQHGRFEVIGFRDPKTGLFVAELPNSGLSPYHSFVESAVEFAKQKIASFLNDLEELPKDLYDMRDYKPLDVLYTELYDVVIDKTDFIYDLIKQLGTVGVKSLPNINTKLLFDGEQAFASDYITHQLHYKNPIHIEEYNKELVDNFLDVFLDEYSKNAVAWYFGAALMNKNIYDYDISKMLVVTSKEAGSGKSTLFNGLVYALFTEMFSNVLSDFDRYFTLENRFAGSSLPAKRMNVYSEAEWQSTKNDGHDFKGLNINAIKTIITEGLFLTEEKFEGIEQQRIGTFHVVLTNHPPQISKEAKALQRRLLGVTVKQSSMASKAKKLGLYGQSKVYEFIEQNVEDFAAYFVNFYKENKLMFVDDMYDVSDVEDAVNVPDVNDKYDPKSYKLEIDKNITELIRELKDVIDVSKLVKEIQNKDFAREYDNKLYINASKSQYMKLGKDGLFIREVFKNVYGKPMSKFKQKYFEVKNYK